MKTARILFIYCLLHTGLLAQFYYPDSIDYGDPADLGLSYEDIYFESSDGTKLHGWLVEGNGNKGTIIHFHGNAQNMSSHFRGISWLAKEGFDLFLFDYRGYGSSEGRPSRGGVFQDCDAAIKKAIELQEDEENFILFGQSLGAANAIALIGENKYEKIKGVIAEAAFYSYKSIAKDKVGGIANLIISDSKSPHLVVDKISPIPILFAHGTSDQVVPYKHSKALYDKAKEPKEFLSSNGARHLTVFSSTRTRNRRQLIETVIKWIEQE
jgi:alpha-beta hydrolase superfamily lysophospholipase